tara:strand:+ start:122 stop:394 length:273 start_codon:yes stop_codon:yes gene_type:complete
MPNFDLNEAVYMYVIYLANGHYYTGISSDIVNRLSQHSSGSVKSTTFLRPVKLIYCELWPSRILAAKHERYVKNIGAKKYLASRQLYLLP